MRKFTNTIILCTLAIFGYGQDNFNLELVANVPVGESGNDVWGYVDSSGVEYAIMGTRTTTKIWSLEDPANPIERASIPGPAGTWRDIKSYEDHLYVTSDQGADGLLIIDMSGAPENITSLSWKPNIVIDGNSTPLNKCHNLYIDTEQGYCYLAGCNVSSGGVLILDLKQDKKDPVHVGEADLNYAHDVYVKNDKLYASEIYLGEFTVYDISDKTNPVLLNGARTSFTFTHNAWLSDDENYLFTTDERGNAFVDAFDISDLDDIKFLDRYQPEETKGQGVIPHNTHYINGFLVTSWYTDGVVITDVTKPDNIVKVGSYDTELNFTGGFEGTWGAYPWLPSGLVLGSDINNGLFVLRPTQNDGAEGYQRAAYLEGMVTDMNTGAQIPNVSVQIVSDLLNSTVTSAMGDYKTGQAQTGTFAVRFSHPNYDNLEVMATLESGEVTTLDVQMGNVIVSGAVVDATDGTPIGEAFVVLEEMESGAKITRVTDESGSWSAGLRANATYNVLVAKWGYLGNAETTQFVVGDDYSTELSLGYEDDFFALLGWENSGTATSGDWAIGEPNLITTGGTVTQSDVDVATDKGSTYYVTGVNGTGAGEDDVDDGSVTITSPPMDMIPHNRIDIGYHLWFANVGGSGTPNDRVEVQLTNGTETIDLSTITTPIDGWSDRIEITVSSDQIAFTNDMRIIVTAYDDDPGHVVEAGFDAFSAVGYTFTNVTDLALENLGLNIYPNPAESIITVSTKSLLTDDNLLTITDNAGKVVLTRNVSSTLSNFNVAELASGIYHLSIAGKKYTSESVKLVKK